MPADLSGPGPGPRRRPTGWIDDQDGAAILEFAIALPILFGLVAACFEIGRAVMVRQVMVEAVGEGARHLARVADPTCRPTCSAEATRVLAGTLDRIVAGTRLPRGSVIVSPRYDGDTDTIAVRAETRLGLDLVRAVGLGPTIRMTVVHEERRLAE